MFGEAAHIAIARTLMTAIAVNDFLCLMGYL
jgi:hypothetical protein